VSHQNHSIRIDDRLRNFVRKKARQIVCKIGRSAGDPEDLEQEIWVLLLPRLPRYDPAIGPPGAFIHTVVNRIAANLLRGRCAQKRDRRSEQSLSVLVRTHDGSLAEWAQTISQDSQDRRLGKNTRSDEERCQLLLDLDEVLTRMPSIGGELAGLLKHMSLSAAARKLGRSVNKTRISVSLILRRFEEAGLRDYL
jgi:DNA-directed RNA polymerase specialized sigma24 family protein